MQLSDGTRLLCNVRSRYRYSLSSLRRRKIRVGVRCALLSPSQHYNRWWPSSADVLVESWKWKISGVWREGGNNKINCDVDSRPQKKYWSPLPFLNPTGTKNFLQFIFFSVVKDNKKSNGPTPSNWLVWCVIHTHKSLKKDHYKNNFLSLPGLKKKDGLKRRPITPNTECETCVKYRDSYRVAYVITKLASMTAKYAGFQKQRYASTAFSVLPFESVCAGHRDEAARCSSLHVKGCHRATFSRFQIKNTATFFTSQSQKGNSVYVLSYDPYLTINVHRRIKLPGHKGVPEERTRNR